MKTLDIAPVKKLSLEAQTTIALRDAIVNGSISPGSRLTEIQISKQMDLSRATVRTAFNQLAKEGLLSLIPYSGWSVVTLTAHDAWELYTLRSSVERLAAQLVAENLDKIKADEVIKAFNNLSKECLDGDVHRVSDADYSFHKTIVTLAQHTRLETQYTLIEQQIRMYLRSSNALIIELSEIISQHSPIVDAILSKNISLAGRLSEQHNLTEGKKLLAHLKIQSDK